MGPDTGTATGPLPACWSPTSPGSSPVRTRACCWPTWGPRSSRWRAPGATTPARGFRRCERVSTYYLAINRNKRSVALDFQDPADLALACELAARADVVIENFSPVGWPSSGWTTTRSPRRTASSTPRSAASAPPAVPSCPLRPDRAGDLRPDESHRRPARRALPRRDLRLRRDVGDAGHHRGARRAAPPGGDRRGQHVEVNLLATALSGMVNQASAYVAGGEVPFRMGNAHPSLFPYEPLPTADGDLIITAGNDGQFAKLVRRSGCETRPTTPGSAATRTAPTARLRPCSWSGCAPRAAWSGSTSCWPPGSPAVRSTRWTKASRSQAGGPDPVVRWARVRTRPFDPQPDHVLGDPGALRPAAAELDEHGEQVRAWLAAPREEQDEPRSGR